jgi:hypothetical protein
LKCFGKHQFAIELAQVEGDLGLNHIKTLTVKLGATVYAADFLEEKQSGPRF